jgi:cytochrome c556
MQKQLMMIVSASVGIAFCATAAISADDDLVAAVKERRDLMKKTVAPAAKLGGQMVKGVKPFDAAEAAKGMEISGVPDKYVTLFPKGTEHGGIADSKIPDKDDQSEAKPEIWENFDDFKKIAMKLKDASAKAAGAAEQGKGTFTAAFNDMTKVCKECHETYREKLEQ